ncbi:unnamed protein product [Ilex paraguariensis]|uniref:Uncharacterized protein n=1 Tax=Ilex paraguariensis TaxID=185542 RepID=A0ABC8S3G5_9AQUA
MEENGTITVETEDVKNETLKPFSHTKPATPKPAFPKPASSQPTLSKPASSNQHPPNQPPQVRTLPWKYLEKFFTLSSSTDGGRGLVALGYKIHRNGLNKGEEGGKGKGKTDDDEVKQKNKNIVVVGNKQNGNRKPKAEVADKKQNGNRKPEVEVTDTNLNSKKFDDSHDDEVPGGDENDGSSLFVVALEMARESCSTMDPLNSGLYSLEVLKKKRPDYENWVGLIVLVVVFFVIVDITTKDKKLKCWVGLGDFWSR